MQVAGMILALEVFLLCFAAWSVWLGLLAGWALAGWTPWWSALVLLGSFLGAGAMAWAAGRHTARQSVALPRFSWPDALLTAAMAFAAFRSFAWLVFTAGPHWWIGSPYNIGDLALHWHMIAYLASGVPFWPESPIFLEGGLRYPIGLNLATALWVCLGVSLPHILVWTSLLGCALTTYALWRWAGAFGLAVFLFSGSLVGWTVLAGNATCVELDAAAWKNLFLSVLVTQRGLLWALPAGLLLCDQWRARLEERPLPLPPAIEAFLYASLPIFHAHTFLYLSVLLGVAFLLAPSAQRWAFFSVGAWAVVPASLLVYFITDGFSAGGGIGWQPGWLMGDQGWLFWWWNFGLWLPLFGWLAVCCAVEWRPAGPGRPWRRSWVWAKWAPSTRVFLLVGWLFIGLCFFLRFAPWAWDNVKLLLWSWLILAPWVWSHVLAPLAAPARFVLLVLLFGGGAIELTCGLHPRHLYTWADRAAVAEAELVLRGLQPKDVRLAAWPGTPQRAAWYGFPLALGYPGHVWSHGYDYQKVEAALHRLLRHGEEDPLLGPVTHVWVGPEERSQFGALIWSTPPPGWQRRAAIGLTELWERRPDTPCSVKDAP